MASSLEESVRADVKTYSEELIRCIEEDVLAGDSRDAVKGALAYLVNPGDLIEDSIPNLGLVDDATVLVTVSKLILEANELGDVLTRDRVASDFAEYEKRKGLIMTNVGKITLEGMAVRGRKETDEKALLDQVRAKVAGL